jgi:hypothetical protein
MRRNCALEQADLDAGFVLTCQSLPVSEGLTFDTTPHRDSRPHSSRPVTAACAKQPTLPEYSIGRNDSTIYLCRI